MLFGLFKMIVHQIQSQVNAGLFLLNFTLLQWLITFGGRGGCGDCLSKSNIQFRKKELVKFCLCLILVR